MGMISEDIWSICRQILLLEAEVRKSSVNLVVNPTFFILHKIA